VHLKFKNWDKYNKRQKDIKSPYWFALSNQIFLDPFFAELSDQERLTFIWLLCEASKQNKYGEVEVSKKLFSQITGFKASVLDETISKLLKSGCAAGLRQDGGDFTASTRQDRTRQDILSSVGQEPTREGNEKADKGSELVNLWNEKASPSLARVIQLSEARRREVAKALKKHPELEFWADVITMMNRSSFLTGDGPTRQGASKPWRCSFDFILKRDNALKILEGSYS